MNNKEPGYVYMLTNPSFREDWVKIGKSSRPVDGEGKSEAEAHDSKLRSDLLFQNGTSNQMNGKSEPSLKIGRELSRQLNIEPAVVLGV